MKITLLNTYDSIGGAAIACKRLHHALTRYGEQSTMLVQGKKSTEKSIVEVGKNILGDKSALFRFALEKLFFYPFEKSRDSRFSFSLSNTGINLSGNASINQSDIIHLHWINQGFLSLKGIRKLFQLKKPIVWTLHDMWAFTGGCHHARNCENYKTECRNCPYLAIPNPTDLSYKIWNRKKTIFKEADLTIVTPSKWLAERAGESSLLAGKTIINIPNPIDINLFIPADKTATKKELGLPENKTIIAFAALITSHFYKGAEYLLNGLKYLAEKYPEHTNKFAILMLGNNKDKKELDLPFECITPGYISDEKLMIKYYQASDIFILPSLEENLPNTIMEAMSCGTPAIAFNVGGIPEMIDHEINGYLAAYKSVEDLVNGIIWLSEDNIRYQALAKKAREKVVAQYSFEIIAKKYSDLYKNLLTDKTQ